MGHGVGKSASMSKNREGSFLLLTGLTSVNSDFKVYDRINEQNPQKPRFERNKLNTFNLDFRE